MLASGRVCFRKERQGVVYAGELGRLAYLSLVVLVGPFQNGMPYIMRERLIRVCSVGQLGADPGFCDFFVSVSSVIYIPCSFCQGSVGFFDSLHSLIGSVDRIAAQLCELP